MDDPPFPACHRFKVRGSPLPGALARGGQREALIYVGVAAAVGGILAAIFGIFSGGVAGAIGGLLFGLLIPLISIAR